MPQLPKTRLKVRLLRWLSLVNITVFITYSWHSYARERSATLDGVNRCLIAAASAVEKILPKNFAERAKTRDAVTPSEYASIKQTFNEYAHAAKVYYIYAFHVGQSGQFKNLASNDSEADRKAGRISRYWDNYAADEEVKSLVQTGIAGFNEGADQFGNFRSFLIPRKLPDGTIFLTGADIEISYVKSLLHASLVRSVLIGLTGYLLVSVVCYWISSTISRDLAIVAKETAKISHFYVDEGSIQHSVIVEVDQVIQSVENMKTGLRSFCKYVPTNLVRDLIASGEEAQLGGRHAELSILFTDIVGFTSVTERMTPEALVKHIGEYLGEMSDIISKELGTVDKYIGDAIMAFWGAPHADPDHAYHACRAGLRCRDRLKDLGLAWAAMGKPVLRARMGINSGHVIVGNMGSTNRLNYTVLGDAVNVASRLEGLNRHYSTEFCVSEYTASLLDGRMVLRPMDRISVKGKTSRLLVFEVLEEKCNATPETIALAESFQEAFEFYSDRNFMAAMRHYDGALVQNPDDGLARTMRERCRQYIQHPPPDNWDGIYAA